MILSEVNPIKHPELFCSECLWVAQWREETETRADDDSFFWEGAHLAERTRPSRKYPEPVSIWYACGLRRDRSNQAAWEQLYKS